MRPVVIGAVQVVARASKESFVVRLRKTGKEQSDAAPRLRIRVTLSLCTWFLF